MRLERNRWASRERNQQGWSQKSRVRISGRKHDQVSNASERSLKVRTEKCFLPLPTRRALVASARGSSSRREGQRGKLG